MNARERLLGLIESANRVYELKEDGPALVDAALAEATTATIERMRGHEPSMRFIDLQDGWQTACACGWHPDLDIRYKSFYDHILATPNLAIGEPIGK